MKWQEVKQEKQTHLNQAQSVTYPTRMNNIPNMPMAQKEVLMTSPRFFRMHNTNIQGPSETSASQLLAHFTSYFHLSYKLILWFTNFWLYTPPSSDCQLRLLGTAEC